MDHTPPPRDGATDQPATTILVTGGTGTTGRPSAGARGREVVA